MLAVNYFGALAVTRAVLPHLRARRSGTVAFVGSMYGWWSPGGGNALLVGQARARGRGRGPAGRAGTVRHPCHHVSSPATC